MYGATRCFADEETKAITGRIESRVSSKILTNTTERDVQFLLTKCRLFLHYMLPPLSTTYVSCGLITYKTSMHSLHFWTMKRLILSPWNDVCSGLK